MKILRKIKSHAKKIFAYLSLFSMFANTLAPFAAILPAYVYAEDTGAPVDEIVVENKEESAPEEADAEDAADGQDLAVEEEDKNNVAEENENAIENPVEEIEDPEAPDILEDGVMDYNPLNDIEEVIEVDEIPTPVEEPIIEEPIVEEPVIEEPIVEESVVEEPVVIAEDSAPSENIEPEAPVVEEPVEEVKEYEYLEDGVEIKDSVDEDWDVEDEKAETVDNVKLGVKYIFPLDEEVTLTFTRLPKDEELRSHLKIERVKVEDLDLPDDFVTDAEYAFDITTDMEDGDFEFDLTLPKPEGSEAEVSYIEKSIDEAKEELKNEDIKKVEEDKLEQDEEDDNVKVKDLNHLTLFIPSSGVELRISGTLTDGIIVEEAEPVDVCNDPSDAYALNSSVGIWTDVSGGSNINGIDTNEVRWGYSTGYGQSGLRFDAVGTQTFDENTEFLLGTLTHMK